MAADDQFKGLKEYFIAGLAMEEAREKREVARATLREAAALKCPEELAALDRASDGLTAAEKLFADTVTKLMKGAQESAARQMMVEHAATCDNPNCAVKAALAAEQDEKAKKPLN